MYGKNKKAGVIAIAASVLIACTIAAIAAFGAGVARADADTFDATYILGDTTIANTAGAQTVNGDATRFGYYTFYALTNTYAYSCHAAGWSYAVAASSREGKRVRVVLASDWSPQGVTKIEGTDSKFSMSFAFPLDVSAAGFTANGSLAVPSGADITLDLNGCAIGGKIVELDDSSYSEYDMEMPGALLRAENCAFTLEDSKPNTTHARVLPPEMEYPDSPVLFTQYTVKRYGAGENGALNVREEIDVPLTGGMLCGEYAIATRYGDNVYPWYRGTKKYARCIDANNARITLRGGTICGFCSVESNANGEQSTLQSVIKAARGSAEICGGRIVSNGCGAQFDSAEVTFTSGEIAHNGKYGVLLTNGSALEMSGGAITETRHYMSNYIRSDSIELCGLTVGDSVGAPCSARITGGKISDNAFVSSGTNDNYNVWEVGNYSLGLGINVINGTLALSGGEIARNGLIDAGKDAETLATKTDRGGIAMNMRCQFIQSDGSIADAPSGSTFTQILRIDGGTISENYGNGVICYVPRRKDARGIELNGGEIRDNESAGVMLRCLHFGDRVQNMQYRIGSVCITGNEGGGVIAECVAGDAQYCAAAGLFGAPRIENNVQDGVPCDFAVNNAWVVGELTEQNGVTPSICLADNVKSIGGFDEYFGDSDDANEIFRYADTERTDDKGAYCYKLAKSGDLRQYKCRGEGIKFLCGYGEEPCTPVGTHVSYTYRPNVELQCTATFDGQAKEVECYKMDIAKYRLRVKFEEADDVLSYLDYPYLEIMATIAPLDLSDKVTVRGAENLVFEYDGSARELSFGDDGVQLFYTYGAEETSLTKGSQYSGDYYVRYENNDKIGTAYAVIAFRGNYTGEVRIPFAVTLSDGAYSVQWQYYVGGAWSNVPPETWSFVPGERGDQSNRVRVKLGVMQNDAPVEGAMRYVYAAGVTNRLDASVTEASTEFVLEITSAQGDNAELRNVGRYTVRLVAANGFTPAYSLENLDTEKNVTIQTFAFGREAQPDVYVLDTGFVYDGNAHRPRLLVLYDGLALKEGTDYMVEFTDGVHETQAVLGGTATAKVRFTGNYAGNTQATFRIGRASNGWKALPNVIRWSYGNFDADLNLFIAAPRYIFEDAHVHFSVLDKSGATVSVRGVSLADIAVRFAGNDCYKVADSSVADALTRLDAASYRLKIWVEETESYAGLPESTIDFNVMRAANAWDTLPSVAAWTAFSFDADAHTPAGKALHGKTRITVTRGDDVYYDSATGMHKLAEAGAGAYTFTAAVERTDNYDGLTFSYEFYVRKAGNHWETSPVPHGWKAGEYEESVNAPTGAGLYGGNAVIRITDAGDTEKVYYETGGVNELASLTAGTYYITATVAGTEDYDGLFYGATFRVFEQDVMKTGLPWWVILLITAGALAVFAAVLLILWKAGVFTVLTRRLHMQIRMQATADATLAAVRAQKAADAARLKAWQIARKKAAEQAAQKNAERAAEKKETPSDEPRG